MKISLDDLARAIERSDVVTSYVDVQKGRVVTLSMDGDDEAAFEHAMRIEEDFERYVPLANLCDSEEPVAMRAFAEAQASATRERLIAILAAPGAVPRFRREVKRLLLDAKWRAFLHEHFLGVARDFCEENAIAYEQVEGAQDT